MVLQSVVPDLKIPKTTLSQYVLEALKMFGNDIALIDINDCNRRYTYAEIRHNITKCASALAKLGVGKGDVVANCFKNCAAYPVITVATAACGGIQTTCNPNYTKDEILQQFVQSEPKVVFVNNEKVPLMREIASNLKSIKHIFTVDESESCTSFQTLIGSADSKYFPENRPIFLDDVALLLFSSGTTGLPKGVMLTHRNIVAACSICRVAMGLSRLDTNYMVMPMFHTYGSLGTICHLTLGVKIVLEQRFTMTNLLRHIKEYKVTTFSAVPPILVALDKLPSLQNFDLSSLRSVACGAAHLPDGVSESIRKKLNIDIDQGWGMTEAVPIARMFYPHCPIKSVGLISPNTLLKVVDPANGKELNANEDGELCVKGPQVTKGYYKNPTATANTIDSEGWLHTGDVGYYDDKGFIYVIDRIKELIKVKGFQVAPAELEEVLLRHEKVQDVAVIGIPDLESGEIPKAFVVKKESSLTEEEIHEFLKDKVSKYKFLRGGVSFVQEIPKTPSGKILRRVLRATNKNKENAVPRAKY